MFTKVRDLMLLLAILAFVLVDVKFGHEEKALSARGPCSLTFPPNLDLGLPHQTRFVGKCPENPFSFDIAHETRPGMSLEWYGRTSKRSLCSPLALKVKPSAGTDYDLKKLATLAGLTSSAMGRRQSSS